MDNLDVQELERRLELSMAVSDAGVYGGCDADCPIDDCAVLATCCGTDTGPPN